MIGIRVDFQVLTGETGGGRVVENCEKRGDVFYEWSLIVSTVPAPLNGAACIKKLLFVPSDYHIKNA